VVVQTRLRRETFPRSGRARNEDVLEVLARAPAGAAVDVPTEALLELEAGAREDLRIEVAPVVDHDEDGRSPPELHGRIGKDGRHSVAVRLE
jgi:hypothetical protein